MYSAFTSLISIRIGITRSAIGIEICNVTDGIKIYKSKLRKRKNG